ncbi:MAG: hypothetical protein ACRDQA_19290 [Nocardioidaceae bacterium]
MRSGLYGIISRQRGIFARHQAIACGYTKREFDAMTTPRTGPWVRVRYGVYADRKVWVGLSSDERLRLRDRAALLVCDEQTVLSHSSAARLLGLPVYDADDGLTHVTRPGQSQTSRVQAGIKHHRTPLDPARIITLDGVRVTDPAKTTLGMAAEFGYRSGLVTADAALREGASRGDLLSLASAVTTEPHAPAMRAVAEAADGRAETPIETLGRILLVNMGITDLELQVVIALADDHSAVVDIYSRGLRHVFEADGRVKYQDQYDARGRLVTADDVVWFEKKREDLVRGTGAGCSRIVWPDVLVENFPRVSARLWQEISDQHGGRLWLPSTA